MCECMLYTSRFYVVFVIKWYWPWQCIERVSQCVLRLSEKESKSAKDTLSSMALSRPITIELYASDRKLTKPVSRTKESRFSSRKQLQGSNVKFLNPYIELTLKFNFFFLPKMIPLFEQRKKLHLFILFAVVLNFRKIGLISILWTERKVVKLSEKNVKRCEFECQF